MSDTITKQFHIIKVITLLLTKYEETQELTRLKMLSGDLDSQSYQHFREQLEYIQRIFREIVPKL